MTPDELRELISGGEKFHVEFKGEEREQLHDNRSWRLLFA